MTQIAVITVVRGRHDHLLRQLAGLRRSAGGSAVHVVVAMGDAAIRELVAGSALVVDLEVAAGAELPLAAARNAGSQLLARYAQAAADPAHADALLCGPVAYLPPDARDIPVDRLAEFARPHSARPDPPDGVVVAATDRRLFWSLSFAVRTPIWERIGGFSTDYTGYGGEDTDFAELAHAAGISMRWVGGAIAYHQHHPVSVPPVEHVAAIVRNARVFHRRWGWWPMTGWLEAFAERGIARYDPAAGWQLDVPTNSVIRSGEPGT